MRKPSVLLLVAALVLSSGLSPLKAEAKKKKGPDPQAEAKLKEGLEPVTKNVDELLGKVYGRNLLSPEEAAMLEEIRFELFSLMKDYPTNAQLVEPVYQAGVLYEKRQRYEEAYEFYSFLTLNFPENPYSMRAGSQIKQMRRLLGENYFPPEPRPVAEDEEE